MFRANHGHAARSANMAPKAGLTCADLIAAAKLKKKYDVMTDGEASARRRPRHWDQVLPLSW